jgi:hypothetical protein
MNKIWSDEIDAILSNGIYLGVWGIRNWAFPREQALETIDKLQNIGVGILGGDILTPKEGKCSYTYDNWHCDPNPLESKSDFIKRSADVSREYITNYIKSDNTFLYSIDPDATPIPRFGKEIDEGLFEDAGTD